MDADVSLSSETIFDWNLCILCQLKKPNKKEKLRHSDDGCDTLADMLPKFAKKGLFNIHKFNCGESEDELRATLKAKKAKYHRECYLLYDQQHYNRLPPSPSEEEVEKSGPSCSKRSKRDSLPLGETICFLCNKSDTVLCAAGAKNASKFTVDKQHVEQMTAKLRSMVLYLDMESVFARISSGDVISNELYYHPSCYKQLVNNYNKKKTCCT